jgi:hypothetical protein
VSWALWNEALQIHQRSGNPIPKRVRMFRRFIVVNALAASCQILGAIVHYSLLLANVQRIEIRQGIFLVRFHFLRVPNLTWTGLFARTSSNVDRYLHGQTRASKYRVD